MRTPPDDVIRNHIYDCILHSKDLYLYHNDLILYHNYTRSSYHIEVREHSYQNSCKNAYTPPAQQAQQERRRRTAHRANRRWPRGPPRSAPRLPPHAVAGATHRIRYLRALQAALLLRELLALTPQGLAPRRLQQPQLLHQDLHLPPQQHAPETRQRCMRSPPCPPTAHTGNAIYTVRSPIPIT